MANGKPPRTVLVTGGRGNLGQKLVAHLETCDWCETIIAIDSTPVDSDKAQRGKVWSIAADLADANDGAWIEPVGRADAIVHLAAVTPYPGCNAENAVISLDMTANLLQRVNPDGCRFLFASSNHVMGGYKDEDWAQVAPLTSISPPMPGTRFYANGGHVRPDLYAMTKLVGERLLQAKAAASSGRFTAVALRIGWCLSGPNDPRNIDAGGSAGIPGLADTQPADEAAHDLIWFRNMWLSNRDLCAEIEAAFTADATSWPAPAIIVNAVSANRGSLWDMAEAKAWLGHEPKDDVWATLGIEPE